MHATQNPARPATNPETAATLRRAALYLIRHGWTQDNTYANEMTPAILRGHTLPAADVHGDTIYKPGTHRPYAADFAALDIKPAGAR